MAIIGSGTLVSYEKSEEEEITTGGNGSRAWVERKVLQADFTGAALETQQFSTPSGFRLVKIVSNVRGPGNEDGSHQETYELEGAFTTTTTTTTT